MHAQLGCLAQVCEPSANPLAPKSVAWAMLGLGSAPRTVGWPLSGTDGQMAEPGRDLSHV